jgi:hypothetical protein
LDSDGTVLTVTWLGRTLSSAAQTARSVRTLEGLLMEPINFKAKVMVKLEVEFAAPVRVEYAGVGGE